LKNRKQLTPYSTREVHSAHYINKLKLQIGVTINHDTCLFLANGSWNLR